MSKLDTEKHKKRVAEDARLLTVIADRIAEVAFLINGEKPPGKPTGKYKRAVYDCGVQVNPNVKVRIR